MRFGLVVAVGALVSVILMGLVSLTSAQTPTPTSTAPPSPSAAPTSTPYGGPTSTITIRFVRGGQPVTVSFLSFPKLISADGVPCPYPRIESQASEFSLIWPILTLSGQPVQCQKGPPTNLRFEFDGLSTEFVWIGSDVVIDIEVPSGQATPTQAPAGPTATPAPVELPAGGASPAGGPSVTLAAAMLLLVAAITSAVIVGWTGDS